MEEEESQPKKVSCFAEFFCSKEFVTKYHNSPAMKRCKIVTLSIIGSSLGLLMLNIIFVFIGATLFYAIETPNEQIQVQIAEKKLNESVFQGSEMETDLLNSLRPFLNANSSSEVNDQLTSLIRKYSSNLKVLHSTQRSYNSTIQNVKWDFASATFLCFTIISTIGYGNIAPVTEWGRGLCLIYGILGIPLFLVALGKQSQSINLLLLSFILYMKQRVYKCMPCCKVICNCLCSKKKSVATVSICNSPIGHASNLEQPERESPQLDSFLTIMTSKEVEEGTVPQSVTFLLFFAYLFIGGWIYSVSENWNVPTGIYFSFITLSTIGFGDVVPKREGLSFSTDLFSIIYIYLGLSLLSVMLSNIADELEKDLKIPKKTSVEENSHFSDMLRKNKSQD